MNRRKFIQAAIASASIAFLPKSTARAVATTNKGFCAENESANAVNALAPDILRIEGGTWCENHSLAYQNGTKWLIDISSPDSVTWVQGMDATAWANVLSHPSYNHRWFMGNEPYVGLYKSSAELAEMRLTNTRKPQGTIIDLANAYVNWMMPLADLIRAHDGIANLIIAGGGRSDPPSDNPSFLDTAWGLIQKSKRSYFGGIALHYYDGMANEANLKQFIKSQTIWINQNMPPRFADGSGVILSEIGTYGWADDAPEVQAFLSAIQNWSSWFGLYGWMWWRQTPWSSPTQGTPFPSLQDNYGHNTVAGSTFLAL